MFVVKSGYLSVEVGDMRVVKYMYLIVGSLTPSVGIRPTKGKVGWKQIRTTKEAENGYLLSHYQVGRALYYKLRVVYGIHHR